MFGLGYDSAARVFYVDHHIVNRRCRGKNELRNITEGFFTDERPGFIVILESGYAAIDSATTATSAPGFQESVSSGSGPAAKAIVRERTRGILDSRYFEIIVVIESVFATVRQDNSRGDLG